MCVSGTNSQPESNHFESYEAPIFEPASLSFEKFMEKAETIHRLRYEIEADLHMLEQVVSKNIEENKMALIEITAKINKSFKRLDHSLEGFIPNRELIEILYDNYLSEMELSKLQHADLSAPGEKQKRSRASSLEFLKKFYNHNVPVIRNGK